jgi:hypothetical protein
MILPVLMGIQPGTLAVLLFPPLNSVTVVRTAQTRTPAAPGQASSADDRQRPSVSASGHSTTENVTQITLSPTEAAATVPRP